MSAKINLTGQRFGRLVVVEEVPNYKSGRVTWKCKCDCGNITYCNTSNLRSGTSTSCGCLRHEKSISANTTHGYSKEHLYYKWCDLKSRCYNHHVKSYKNYGGRGIKMCDEWKNDYLFFRDWAFNNGYKEGLTIDRIDVNGNYEPSNCRWITMEEQAKNKRNTVYVEWNGQKYRLKELAKELGETYGNIKTRYYRGTLTDYLNNLKG